MTILKMYKMYNEDTQTSYMSSIAPRNIANCTRYLQLFADAGKTLVHSTDGRRAQSILIPWWEEKEWQELDILV